MIETNGPARLIAVDWGTSNFRAWLLGAGGRVLDHIRAPRGVSHVKRGEFATGFRALLAPWLPAVPQVPVVMAGMVGSADGWVEAPYLPCPADLNDIAAGMVAVRGLDDGRQVRVVPGLSAGSMPGNYDVMRGEEVQILGALELITGYETRLYCVPGTHSKWVSVDGTRVSGFSTSMTGDAYKALSEHSFLARSIAAGEHDENAFDRGLAQAGRAGGLLHHLFGVRTEVLRGSLLPQSAASYLSGVLIGNEVGAMLDARNDDGGITVIGGRSLAPLYDRAIRVFGRNVCCIDGDEAACRGLYRLAAQQEIVCD